EARVGERANRRACLTDPCVVGEKQSANANPQVGRGALIVWRRQGPLKRARSNLAGEHSLNERFALLVLLGALIEARAVFHTEFKLVALQKPPQFAAILERISELDL